MAISAFLWELISVQEENAVLLHSFFWSFPFLYPLTKAFISDSSTIREFQFYTAAKSRGFRKGCEWESLMNNCDILPISKIKLSASLDVFRQAINIVSLIMANSRTNDSNRKEVMVVMIILPMCKSIK